jgi:uridine kinase
VTSPAEALADAARGRPLIALDGPGGSGKTTLAAAVAGRLDGAVVVHGDDFYRPMPVPDREQLDAEQGYHCYFDWQRLRDEVLTPLRAGRPARYRSFDWATGELGDSHEIGPGPTVIVEGVYAARPELAPYYDLTAFVDTPREICLRRVRARGQDSAEWIARWRAAEDFYLRTTNPPSRLQVVVRGW